MLRILLAIVICAGTFIVAWLVYEEVGRLKVLGCAMLVASLVAFIPPNDERTFALFGFGILVGCGVFVTAKTLQGIEDVHPFDRASSIAWHSVMGLGHGVLIVLPYLLGCLVRRRVKGTRPN